MQTAGITGCLVTGRMYRATLPFVRELDFEAPVICYQGAAIIDPATDESCPFALPTTRSRLDRPPARPACTCSSIATTSTIARLATDSPISTRLSKRSRSLCPRCAKPSHIVPRRKPSSSPIRPMRQTMRTLRGELGKRANVTRSLPEFVEVLDPAVDKGNALRYVAGRLGIPMEQTAAIGDSWNDAPLLRAAGLRLAMGSAPDE